MAAETNLNKQLFDDSFLFRPQDLSKLYLEHLQDQEPDGHDDAGRYHPYALSNKSFLRDVEVSVYPETFHQAVDMEEASAEAIIETAKLHYQQIRQLGMKVVGHLFGVVEHDSDHFVSHSYYPTILSGAKYLRPYTDASRKMLDLEIGGTLNEHTIEKHNLSNKLLRQLLEPVQAYYNWCQSSNQPYVLSQLNYLHSFVYFAPTKTIGLQTVETRMGSVELGNLDARRRDFKHFAKSINALAE
jgi:hypothetical protein